MDYQLGPGPLQVDQNTIDEKIKGDIGIVENGDVATHAIPSGYYVIWKGDLYVSKTDISSGTTLGTSNLTAKPNGLGAEVAALNSNIAKVVENGNVQQGHVYCLHLVESTISNAAFEILYNPNDNNGIQTFSICLTNGTNIYCCTAKMSLSNGQLSVSEAYRKETGASGADAWNVSIRVIRMIA